MLNKTLLAVVTASLLSGVAFNASAADAGHGKVTFKGEVISAPCSIAPGDEDLQVNLGEVADSALNSGKFSLPVDFTIHLQDCTLTGGTTEAPITISKAKVTFNSANEDATTKLLKNTYEGNYGAASNVGVRILTEGKANVDMGVAQVFSLVAGKAYQELNFKARMESPTKTATAGDVYTQANYILAYE
ncbi:fimbrial-like protein [Enterobacter bugandensis]